VALHVAVCAPSPALIKAPDNQGRFPFARSLAFAVENLLVATRAVGLGTTPTNFHFFFEDEYRALLGLPSEVGIHYLTPLGYPPEFPTGLRPELAKARRPWRTLVHEDAWGQPWGAPVNE
jgi:nitroreductase